MEGMEIMSNPLFQTTPTTPNTEVDDSKKNINTSFSAFVELFKREYDRFWRNENGFTPQQMADAWGTDVVAMFTNSTVTKNFINSVDPNLLDVFYQSPPMNITVNPNGTVTLSEL